MNDLYNSEIIVNYLNVLESCSFKLFVGSVCNKLQYLYKMSVFAVVLININYYLFLQQIVIFNEKIFS